MPLQVDMRPTLHQRQSASELVPSQRVQRLTSPAAIMRVPGSVAR
jgi:hypothetical protein